MINRLTKTEIETKLLMLKKKLQNYDYYYDNDIISEVINDLNDILY